MESKAGMTEFLHGLAVFRALEKTQCEELVKRCNFERYDRRHVVQRSGEKHHHLYVVVTGKLEMEAVSPSGETLTLAVFGPKSMSSWLALFYDDVAQRNLIALADTRVLAIPAKAIREILDNKPSIYPEVLRHEGKRFRAALDLAQLVLSPNRSKRLATLLMMLVEVSGDSSDQPRVLMTHVQLQKIANCSRQVLHQNLKQLQHMGLIEQAYGFIKLINIKTLKSYAKES